MHNCELECLGLLPCWEVNINFSLKFYAASNWFSSSTALKLHLSSHLL